MDTQIQALLQEIIELTQDSQSQPFWLKAIRKLGTGIVWEEVRETKYQLRLGKVDNPAAYLTRLLKNQMDKVNKEQEVNPPAKKPEEEKKPRQEKMNTYFEHTQLMLFKELKPIRVPREETVENKGMELPYSKKHIPWLTFIGPEFFTLSTNKTRSDKIQARVPTQEGSVNVSVIRGRYRPGGEELGILTAQHGKVIAGIEYIWVQQGCQYHQFKNGSVSCYCYVSIRELAKTLGWKKFGGRDLIRLSNTVTHLKIRPYYFDLSNFENLKFKGYGFTLVKDVTLMEGDKGEALIKVEFSDPISRQLLHRHAVSRTKELPRIKSELAFLLRLYLEPRLFSLDGKEFSIALKNLIGDLQLPQAGWHKKSTWRKVQFAKALPEIDSHRVADGREIVARIEKGFFDYVLVAKLITPAG